MEYASGGLHYDPDEASQIYGYDALNTSLSGDGDEDEMDRDEIEAMLYSQIYFEPQPEDVQPQDVVLEEVKTSTPAAKVSAMASMLNFSGRHFSTPPQNLSLEKTKKKKKSMPRVESLRSDSDVINLTDGDTSKDVITVSSDSKDTPTRKGKSKNVVVLSDSDFEVEPERKIKKSKKGTKEISEKLKKNKTKQTSEPIITVGDSSDSSDFVEPIKGKSSAKRCKENIYLSDEESVPKKKKKSKKSSEIFSSCSDSEDDLMMMLGDSGILMEDDSIHVHARGVRKLGIGFKPISDKKLAKIDINTWEGEPPLTLEQVHRILKPGTWAICNDDKFLTRAGPRRVLCNNCKESGHFERRCTKPRKIPACTYCGDRSHAFYRCPANKLCFSCHMPGHDRRDCTRRFHDKAQCRRCSSWGHQQSDCHEVWRQFHMTTKEGPVVKPKTAKTENSRPFCYNCGKAGHLGYDCPNNDVMTRSTHLYPFISKYQTSGSGDKQRDKTPKNIPKRGQPQPKSSNQVQSSKSSKSTPKPTKDLPTFWKTPQSSKPRNAYKPQASKASSSSKPESKESMKNLNIVVTVDGKSRAASHSNNQHQNSANKSVRPERSPYSSDLRHRGPISDGSTSGGAQKGSITKTKKGFATANHWLEKSKAWMKANEDVMNSSDQKWDGWKKTNHDKRKNHQKGGKFEADTTPFSKRGFKKSRDWGPVYDDNQMTTSPNDPEWKELRKKQRKKEKKQKKKNKQDSNQAEDPQDFQVVVQNQKPTPMWEKDVHFDDDDSLVQKVGKKAKKANSFVKSSTPNNRGKPSRVSPKPQKMDVYSSETGNESSIAESKGKGKQKNKGKNTKSPSERNKRYAKKAQRTIFDSEVVDFPRS